MSQYEVHPLAEIFPPLSDQDLSDLSANIAANGQRLEIVLLDGRILDGRNREAACIRAGVHPRYRDYDPASDGEDPLEFVWSMNFGRRHLTFEQRVGAAERYANLKRGSNQHTARAVSISQKQAAEKFGVSEDSIQRRAKIRERGTELLNQKVDAGEVPIRKAAQIAELPKGKQTRLLQKSPAGKVISIESRKRVESIINSASSAQDFVPWSGRAKADDASFVAFLEFASESYRKLNGGSKYARMLDGLIEDIEEVNVSHLYKPIRDKIMDAVDAGYQREADIRRCAGITKDEFEFAIKLLINGRLVEEIFQGGKTEVARGQRNRLYKRAERPADRDHDDDDLEDDGVKYDFEMNGLIAA